MEPEVLHLIPCDDIQADPNNLHRLDVRGLLIKMVSRQKPPFPIRRPLFHVLVLARGCVGVKEVSLKIVQQSTQHVIFQSDPRTVRFVGSPEQILGWKFNVVNCVFPAAGIYWIEFVWSETTIARKPLFLLSLEDD